MSQLPPGWERRETKRPELEGFEVLSLASHMPDKTAVQITLQARRAAGERYYRVTDAIALDDALQHPLFVDALNRLEGRLADAVAEYEAANPVQEDAKL